MSIGSKPSTPCFDAGSQYCPCALSELGQCVACSLLRGEQTCDCGWSGVCVYSEYVRNKSAHKSGRPAHSATVLGRWEIAGEGMPGASVALGAELAVPEDIAAWCSLPGSFVLVRPSGSTERWNVPLCVAGTKGRSLTVAVEVAGPKTTALARNLREGSKVTLVGPFWSGIQGHLALRKHGGSRVLAVAKGINQATLVQVAQYVSHRGGTLKALIGPGTLGAVFVLETLEACGASVEILPREKDHNLARIFREITRGHCDLLISAGGDAQHNSLEELLQSLPEPPAFAWSSNLTMTCAEGICGSCLKNGFRGCKSELSAQMPSET